MGLWHDVEFCWHAMKTGSWMYLWQTWSENDLTGFVNRHCKMDPKCSSSFYWRGRFRTQYGYSHHKNWRWHKVFPRHSFIWSHKYTRNKLSPATNWFFPHFWYMCLCLLQFLQLFGSFLTCYNTFFQAVTCYLTSSYLDSWCESFPPLFVLQSNLFSGALISWWAD